MASPDKLNEPGIHLNQRFSNQLDTNTQSLNFLLVSGNLIYCVVDFKNKKILNISESIKSITGYTPEWAKKNIATLSDAFFCNKQHISKILWKAFRFHLSKPVNQRSKYRYTSCFKCKHIEGHNLWLMFHFIFPLNESAEASKIALFTASDVSCVRSNENTLMLVSWFNQLNQSFENIYCETISSTNNLTLINKEYDILRLIANGDNNGLIAEKLNLSKYTVESYRKQLIKKFEAKNIYHVIKQSKKYGFI
jgi:DNA-binding CsgD family transcriptional regulator